VNATKRASRYAVLVTTEDERLFDATTRGDRQALDQLMQRYLPQLHAFVHARLGPKLRALEGSVDVVQSVCRELVAAREDFDFRGEDRFRAWLFTTALNKVRERHRRLLGHQRNVEYGAPDADAAAATMANLLTPSQDAIGNETTTAVREALAALDEEHREVITLARFAGLPHRVIAEVMERSEDATRQLLARALRNLAQGLRQRGIDLERWQQP
jgi:RNA polymerase sigma-70 factor, ECF subfamily